MLPSIVGMRLLIGGRSATRPELSPRPRGLTRGIAPAFPPLRQPRAYRTDIGHYHDEFELRNKVDDELTVWALYKPVSRQSPREARVPVARAEDGAPAAAPPNPNQPRPEENIHARAAPSFPRGHSPEGEEAFVSLPAGLTLT
jgi:hypothetical protein